MNRIFLGGDDYWLGLDGSANTWYDGNPSTYRNWASNEPNENSECIYYRNTGWADRQCTGIVFYYTCKKQSLHPGIAYLYFCRLF